MLDRQLKSNSYLAIATDYDGTIAENGRVKASTWGALSLWRQSGKKLILVTGRILDDLLRVCDRIEEFDLIVAENGAIIYCPLKKEVKLLAKPPNEVFIENLKKRGVDPVLVGQVIVATWQPHQQIVTEVIQEMDLSLEVILNKRAVMVLPAGVNKASGMEIAIEQLNISPDRIIAVGDAENDIDLLKLSGLGVAVGNATPELKKLADWVTQGERGKGVEELIEKISIKMREEAKKL